MSVKGSAKEKGEGFVKETGFAEYRVICVNPDKEALEILLGTTIEKEIEYLKTDENGIKQLSLVFWLKSVKDEKKIKSLRFYLKDVVRTNKDNTKTQYINSTGITTWADGALNLPEWFTTRDYREAHEGEEELYNFAQAWLNKIDFKKDLVLDFEWKKLMMGNIREISSQIRGEYEDTVTILSVVRVVEKDGETKEYEQLYNRRFLPGYAIKNIRLIDDLGGYIEKAQATTKKDRSRVQRFILEAVDPTYGIKDYFTLGEVQPYDPTKNIVTTSKVLDDSDTQY